MGIFPIWGFQMIVAISLSILWRLNKALVIIASNVSIPPLMPAIIYASYLTGKLWMGKNAQDVLFEKEITWKVLYNDFWSFHELALQYFSGAVTLASISGLVFGALTYGSLKIFRKLRRR